MHRLVIALWGAIVCAQVPNVKLEDPAVIAKGSSIFASTCGIGYCHGKEGRASRGPRLAGKKWDQKYLFQTISEGVNNSLMPAFKSQLPASEIWSVVAYILTLGSGSAPHAEPQPAVPQPPASIPRRLPPGDGDPDAGRALFFDASNPKRCAACHRIRGRGADIGPDLTGIATRPAPEILADIVDPNARLSIDTYVLVTRSGERIIGLKKQETAELMRIYDTSTIPPVLRTIYKDQIQSVDPQKRSPMPGDYGQLYSQKQLLDLVAFLKSVSVPPEQE